MRLFSLNLPERKGMVLKRTYVKPTRNGKSVSVAVIDCSCGRQFEATLSRWNHGLFDSCKACGLKRSKEKGCGIFGGGKNLGRKH